MSRRWTSKQKSVFWEDKNESIVISFEGDMICLDMQDNILTKEKILESEYRTGNKYIHQLKELTKDKDIVYFHIEVLDENGVMHICPGQLL
mgnify:FL=1